MVRIRDFHEVEAAPTDEGVTMRVVIGPNEGAPTFNMRIFEVQPGFSSPHHSHWWEHEIFVLAGQGLFKTEQGEFPVSEGSAVFVPGNEMHQLKNVGDEVVRFICLVPQEWLSEVKRPN